MDAQVVEMLQRPPEDNRIAVSMIGLAFGVDPGGKQNPECLGQFV